METREYGDYWVLSPPENQITRLLIDFTFTIQMLNGERGTEIRIEVPFTIRISDDKYFCDPEKINTISPALAIYFKEIKEIRVTKNGTLNILIASDIEITVPPHTFYESWNITSSGWHGVTALPEGSVAFWEPQIPSKD